MFWFTRSTQAIEPPRTHPDIGRLSREPIDLEAVHREELARIMRSPTIPPQVIRRARLVLLVADGSSVEIAAEMLSMSVTTARRWLAQFQVRGAAGLLHYRGTQLRVLDDPWEVIAATLESGPGADVAAILGLPIKTVSGLWEQFGVRRRRDGELRFATEPPLVAAVTDVLGLLLAGHLRVIALRVAPGQPLDPGASVTELAAAVAGFASWRPGAAPSGSPETGSQIDEPSQTQGLLAEFVVAVLARNPGARCRLVVDDPAVASQWADDLKQAGLPVRVLRVKDAASWERLVRVWCALVEQMGDRQRGSGAAERISRILGASMGGEQPATRPFTWVKGTSSAA